MGTKADVLLVVVTETETKAVIDAFKPVSRVATKVTINDRVCLDLGTVNNSRVFLALSEMGTGGVGGAQQSVSKALTALDANAVLMVGIAFGVDDKKQSISFGESFLCWTKTRSGFLNSGQPEADRDRAL